MASVKVSTPTAQAFDIPLIGNDLAKIGRIIDLYADPCSPDAELWVYGFFQAIPTMFITLTKPELWEFKSHKGSHRPRKGRRARFKASAVFRDAIVEIPTPRWVVFRIYQWKERIGWYFLVADALEDFAINWMSMAYKWQGCQGAVPPYITFNTTGWLQGISNGTSPIIQDTEYNNLFDNDSIVFGPTRVGTYRCSWTARWEPYLPIPDVPTPYNTVLEERVDGFWRPIAIGETSTGTDGRAQSSGDTTILCNGDEEFRLASQSTQDGYAWFTGFLEMSALKIDAIAPDP